LPFILAENIEVSMKFMRKDEIVLNLSLETCRQLSLDNDWINFRARFGWIQRKIMVPESHVFAIYSQENHQRMSFPINSAKNPDPSNTSQGASKAPKRKTRLDDCEVR
jgi:stringent starvation protein B